MQNPLKKTQRTSSTKSSGLFGNRHWLAWRFLFVWSFVVANLSVLAQKPVPELWGLHVHDDAKVLSQETIDQLENQLRVFEDSTSNQVAILIVNSLDGDVLEDYSLRVVEKWKLGTKDHDNGVLLLVAIEDHKIRIETGYGLEGALTDALCAGIIRNEIAPHFRKDEYDAGITAAVNAIEGAIKGEYTVDTSNENGIEDLGLKERILIGLFIFVVLGSFTFIGVFVQGCASWFLYAFLIPFYASFPMVVLGVRGGLTALGIYVVGYPLTKFLIGRSAWGKRMTKKIDGGRGGGGGGSGWSSWSGGGSSSGSSGGGFSGGGGSFGGGGSSGSW